MLVDAARVAEYLGVSRDFVYEHADEIAAARFGCGTSSLRSGRGRFEAGVLG
jgi:hypothetical protein